MHLRDSFKHFVKTLRSEAETRNALRLMLVEQLTNFREEFPCIAIDWYNDAGQIRIKCEDHVVMHVGIREDNSYCYQTFTQQLMYNHSTDSSCTLGAVMSALGEWFAMYALNNDIPLGQESQT